MDYTGTRRASQEKGGQRDIFFKWICDEVIARVHPEIRYDPRTGQEVEPERADTVKNWRLAGFYLGTYLLPRKKVRRPTELESCIEGMRQRMEEYELENALPVEFETFDVEECEKVEEKGRNLLNRAVHSGTPIEEARNSALGFAKMVAKSDLVVLSFARVSHFMQRFTRMEELFELMRRENPLLFFYGDKSQRH